MRHKIYTYILLGGLFFILIAAKEQCEIASLDMRESERKSVSEVEKRGFHIANPERLRFTIENPNGNIMIRGNDSNEISITATKQWYMKAKGIEVEAQLKEIQSGVEMITYEESDTALNVKVRRVKSGVVITFKGIEFRVDFEISVPRELKEICIHSSNGSTVIENTHCNLEIESANGEVKTDIDGKKTKISLANGNIEAKIIGGETFFSSTNGRMEAEIDSGKVFTSGKNGFVNIILNSPQGGEVSFTNSYITTNINNPQDLKIIVEVINGGIKFAGLENLIKQGGDDRSSRKIIGVVGKPDKELKIHTTNGNIRIRVESDTR